MRWVDEFNDPVLGRRLLDEIARTVTRPWTLMEICGGQTHSIVRHGIDRLLPEGVELLHGPGCPVCVTPLSTIDRALAIASTPGVVFCSFGDMLRVPGSHGDLMSVKAAGGDVRIVMSPLDAVRIAAESPDRQVVFFSVGFETTAPATALAVRSAHERGIPNFSVLVAHVLVPPAIDAIMSTADCRVQAMLAAGHVCAVMGTEEYRPVADRHRLPIVVTGFEPLDLLDGIRRAIVQLERGTHDVENAYARAVTDVGNPSARQLLADLFEVCDRDWRGIGTIPASGWRLRTAYRRFDAEHRFEVGDIHSAEHPGCRSGDVLRGLLVPTACPEFGTTCTPLNPLGAPMVSAEGTCAAYFTHRRTVPSRG